MANKKNSRGFNGNFNYVIEPFLCTIKGNLMTSKDSKAEEGKQVYDSRENWPPYTYRDYPEIKPGTYHAFIEFLNTENTSGRLMELQPWVSVCDSRCAFCYFPTTASSKNKRVRRNRAWRRNAQCA
jgi:hypothetical protein